MQQYKPFIFILLAVMLAACHTNNKWQKVEYDNNLACNDMKTYCKIENDVFQKAHVYLEEDTLFILFYDSQGWESWLIKVHNDKFCAFALGIPFEPIDISYTTMEQKLQLAEKHYAVGDTLCGRCYIRYRSVETSNTGNPERKMETGLFSFGGTIREVVRDKDFNPFDEANFMTFDMPTALLELGEPLFQEKFQLRDLPDIPQVWVEYFFQLSDSGIQIEDLPLTELTWNTSPTSGISDEGGGRLTILYIRFDSIHWKPVQFYRWNRSGIIASSRPS